MATLLLIIIYILAIGLGIPDSAFGSAWPVMYLDFGIDMSMANVVSFLASCGTIMASLFSAKLINRFGTAAITAVSTALTVAALFGYAVSPSIWVICLLAIPLGFGGGAVDTAINNYMALRYNAMCMNFMHCFYGVGVMISPYVMSWALRIKDWRYGYIIAGSLQSIIALVAIIAIPLWKKVKCNVEGAEDTPPRTLKFSEMLKTPAILWASLFFFASTSVEGLCTVWCSTYMVNTKGFTAADAAGYLVLYFFGLTTGRILSGLLSNKLSTWTLLKFGICFGTIGCATVFIAYEPILTMIGLFLIGCGVAPVFPGLVFLTPRNFGVDVSQSVTGFELSFAYTGMMISPVIFGFFAGLISTYAFPFFVLFFEVMMAVCNIALVRSLKKQGKTCK